MGCDKATLVVDGRMMAVRVADALRQAGAEDVWAVGGPAEALAAAGQTVLPDAEPGGGPLQAVVTALRVAAAPVVVVVSCDLLEPSPAAMVATVRALIPGSDGEAAEVPVDVAVPVDGEGRRQWMHGAWRRARALQVLETAMAQGERALWRAARDLRVVDVGGLDPVALRDADSPADLARRRRHPGPEPDEG